jgi:hypothetical protein
MQLLKRLTALLSDPYSAAGLDLSAGRDSTQAS